MWGPDVRCTMSVGKTNQNRANVSCWFSFHIKSVLGMPRVSQALCNNLSHCRILLLWHSHTESVCFVLVWAHEAEELWSAWWGGFAEKSPNGCGHDQSFRLTLLPGALCSVLGSAFRSWLMGRLCRARLNLPLCQWQSGREATTAPLLFSIHFWMPVTANLQFSSYGFICWFWFSCVCLLVPGGWARRESIWGSLLKAEPGWAAWAQELSQGGFTGKQQLFISLWTGRNSTSAMWFLVIMFCKTIFIELL